MRNLVYLLIRSMGTLIPKTVQVIEPPSNCVHFVNHLAIGVRIANGLRVRV
jgi:hypothetical protein